MHVKQKKRINLTLLNENPYNKSTKTLKDPKITWFWIWDSWKSLLMVEVYNKLVYVNRVHRNISTPLTNARIMGVRWIKENICTVKEVARISLWELMYHKIMGLDKLLSYILIFIFIWLFKPISFCTQSLIPREDKRTSFSISIAATQDTKQTVVSEFLVPVQPWPNRSEGGEIKSLEFLQLVKEETCLFNLRKNVAWIRGKKRKKILLLLPFSTIRRMIIS